MAFRVDLSRSSSLAAFMVGLTYLPVMKVDQKGCSFTSCFSGRILFSSFSLDLNTSEPGTDYVSGKYCESMKRKKQENVKAKDGWFFGLILGKCYKSFVSSRVNTKQIRPR